MANAICPSCGGQGGVLGTLGFLRHFRCRDCGAEFSRKIRRRARKTAPLPRAKVRWVKRGGKLIGAYKSFRAVVWDKHGSVDAPMAHLYEYRVTNSRGQWKVQGSASRLDNAMRYVEESMKGVAGNPLTVRETRDLMQHARFEAGLARMADQPTKSILLGKAQGQFHAAYWYGRGRKERRRAGEMESAIDRLSTRGPRLRDAHRTVRKNPLFKRTSLREIDTAEWCLDMARKSKDPFHKAYYTGEALGRARVVASTTFNMEALARAQAVQKAVREIKPPGVYANGKRKRCCNNPAHRRAMRNRAIDTAWTGKKADFVSKRGDYGAAPHSELAMHTGTAGARIVRFALFSDANRWPFVTWAHIETSTGRVLDGTAGEVLPTDVRRKLGGFGNEKMPMAARLKK